MPISVSCLPCQPDGDRADRVHVDQADLLPAVPDVVGDDRAVGDRVGVGHREHRGVAAQSRCRRTGFDVLGVFAAGLAQVGVQVDEAGQQDLAAGVDDVGIVGIGEVGADLGDLAVVDQHVDAVALAVEPHPADQSSAHALIASRLRRPTSRWNSTAIRTCTPLETCCSTADCDESATEDAISMPRSIGPGCSTTALPASSACRFSDSP